MSSMTGRCIKRFVALLVCWILILFTCVQGLDDIYRNVDVITKVGNPCSFPSTIPIIITTDNLHLSLNLRKSSAISSSLPVYIQQPNSTHITAMYSNTDGQVIATYQNREYNAAFVIECINLDEKHIQKWHGEFTLNNIKRYFLQPDNVYPSSGHILQYIGDHQRPYINTKELNNIPRERLKRAASKVTYYIEVLVVTDYLIFQRFFDQIETTTSTDEKREMTLDKIKTYYAHAINAVNLRYKNMASETMDFEIKLVGYFISDSVETSGWIVPTDSTQFPAQLMLQNFERWKSKKLLMDHDHAILFTGYDLTDTDSSTEGRAPVESMCTDKSFSVVEDRGISKTVAIATHEMGHSLGSLHDSDAGCNDTDRYIMAGSIQTESSANKLNPWYFSSCSVAAIEQYVDSVNSIKSVNCLTEILSSSSVVPDISDMSGQVYSLDDQCRQLHGAESFYCQNRGNLSGICRNLPCFDPKTFDCISQTAATGSSCASKMWCLNGECKYSNNAPNITDCFDQHRIVLSVSKAGEATRDLYTCQSAVSSLAGICYIPSVIRGCCASCNEVKSSVQGCEYGDSIKGCVEEGCNRVEPDGYIYNKGCCRTCKLTSEFKCIDQDENMCTSNIAINGYIFCYNTSFAHICCKSCESVRNTAKTGCEYGDRINGCLQFTNNGTRNCDPSCCKTCARPTNLAVSHNLPCRVLILQLFSILIILSIY
ncbi:disintegrin and metalloproteinase domain-containing protein 10 isoform X2 [Patella vulgata]|uniref:disintegrin and metalloproteinase domain-containing protein 10 isoform X2 n=1 Tax=Patella vulgata TaxID=6465 RepID=UPI0021808D19|nr:disintegrin and metalloproteinase domain-containing protein 10 isoform X2 [Patella vulgata]